MGIRLFAIIILGTALVRPAWAVDAASPCPNLYQRILAGLFPTPKPSSSYQELVAQAEDLVRVQERNFDRIFPSTGFPEKPSLVKAIKKNGPETAALLKTIQDEDVDFAIRTHARNRDGIAAAGIKNVRETGHSSSGYGNRTFFKNRDREEAFRLFRWLKDYRDLENGLKPKYGYLRSRGGQNNLDGWEAASKYGGDVFVLKKERLRSRTTWSAGDSLTRYSQSDGPARSWEGAFVPWKDREVMVPVLEQPRQGREFRLRDPQFDSMSSLRQFTGKPRDKFYLELQFWGPITLDDVESFSFSATEPSGEFLRRLLEKKIRIFDLRSGRAVEWRADQ